MRPVRVDESKVLLETATRPSRVSARERQRSDGERGVGLPVHVQAGIGEHPLSLFETTLPDAQVRETRQRSVVEAGARALCDVQTGVQLTLGFRPPAPGGEDAAIEDPALRVEERASVGC